MTGQNQRRLLIAGGGIAGLEIASTLGRRFRSRRNAPDVALLESDTAHIWKPMLHTIAAGTRDISQQQTSYIAHALEAGFTHHPGEMTGVERLNKVVHVAPIHAPDGRLLVPARHIPYDKLVIAIGSRANDFGTPGASAYCMSIDSRRQADAFNQEIRIRLLQTSARELPLRIAIVGGGATGVELAAELVQLIETSIEYGAKNLRSHMHITLIESGPRLLAAFPEDISQATLKRLEFLGIQILLNTHVSEVTPNAFILGDGTQVEAELKVWAAGVKAPDVLASLEGLEVTRTNQLVVNPKLQTADPDIYAVGDCASATLAGSQWPLPPTAQVAHQQARYLIENLPDLLENGITPPDYVHRDLGAIVSLGEYDAFGSLGKFGFFTGVTFRGRLAQLSHMMLYRSHQARLHGFWRGTLLWIVDRINARVRARIRLD